LNVRHQLTILAGAIVLSMISTTGTTFAQSQMMKDDHMMGDHMVMICKPTTDKSQANMMAMGNHEMMKCKELPASMMHGPNITASMTKDEIIEAWRNWRAAMFDASKY